MKKIAISLIVFALGLCLLSAFQCASASSITQGEYAIKLAEKLGLEKDLSVAAAIAALTKLEIIPADGFKSENYMNPVIAGEIRQAAKKACEKGLLSSLPCCKQSNRCCMEVDAIVSSLNEELGLLPPTPPTPPPPPPRHPASPAS